MRPLRLDMIGFAAFRRQTTLDFTDTPYFALVGPTGAGKSTVLDAICFALYGKVPRWGGGSVRDALAPTTNEARVRLVFAAGGQRYVATRVLRRDKHGAVSTWHAGLERIPATVDLAKLDEFDASKLGEVLAGTPKEMNERVPGVTGLPFEQFTKCVVLPQGAFADFLKATNAERQAILTNLLGLEVYKQIQQRAGADARTGKAVVEQLDRQIAELGAVSDEDIEAAKGRISAMQDMEAALRARVPALREARAHVERVQNELSDVDGELALLSAVRAPIDLADTTRETARAQETLAGTRARLQEAELAEERLRAALGDTDTGALAEIVRAHDDRADIIARLDKAAVVIGELDAETARAETAVAEAADRVQDTETVIEHAQQNNLAAALRPHLAEGRPCPVCDQRVERLPKAEPTVVLDELRKVLTERRGARKQAEDALGALKVKAGTYTERRDELASRLSDVNARLAGAPTREEAAVRLAAAERHRTELKAASRAVNEARQAQRTASAAVEAIKLKQDREWHAFDAIRNGVAKLDPPPFERDDLAASWKDLADWAAERLSERRTARSRVRDRVLEAETAAEAVDAELRDILTAQGISVAQSPDGTEYLAAATRAVAHAEGEHKLLCDRRDQTVKVQRQRAEKYDAALVSEALSRHLGARNFQEWLLREALDTLVDDATEILRELSAGQYDLAHDGGDFYVVDHHDAGQRRPVRTLSGGETFAASLALALSLSRQLAGMSTQAAHLESIMLDEGFGTLDASTLDTVATTLETLATRGNRMVGVVTHVAALADRIPVRFEVVKDATGASVTKVES